MVKTIRALVVVFAALAGLGSCDLTYGIFPGRLMGYEAYADLSGYIDPDHARDYNFQIIRNSSDGTEYLVMADENGAFGDDCVVVMNDDLKVLGHYSLSQLDDMDTANPFNSCGAMVDSSGRIVVGNRRFTAGGRSLVYSGTPPVNPHQPGLALPGAIDPNPNITNIYISGTELRYSIYSSDWTLAYPERFSVIGGGTNYAIEYLGLSGTTVIMVTRRDGPIGEIFQVPQDDLTPGPPCTPLEGFYVHPPIPTPNEIEWRTLGYTNEGFAAYRWTSNQYYRFELSGLEIGTPLDVPDDKDRPHNQKHLYGRESGWYIFDMNELTIVRRAWWWK
jgi:hypothetical protein